MNVHKVALVTGGNRGIGAAICDRLASSGYEVIGTWRLAMDVTDRASVESFVRKMKPTISLLVNNAGINKPCDFDQVTDAEWDEVLATNLRGPFVCSQVFMPQLIKTKGAIVHIGSVSGQIGGPRTPHYAASKAGLVALSQCIARFGAKHGVRSNVVSPGYIRSPMTDAALESPDVQRMTTNVPLQRLGTAEEVANAVAFLASDEASYITGQVLNVNGGLYW